LEYKIGDKRFALDEIAPYKEESKSAKLCFSTPPVSNEEAGDTTTSCFGVTEEEVQAFADKVDADPSVSIAESLAAVLRAEGITEAVALVLLAEGAKVWSNE
jgi:hypothetical protein